MMARKCPERGGDKVVELIRVDIKICVLFHKWRDIYLEDARVDGLLIMRPP